MIARPVALGALIALASCTTTDPLGRETFVTRESAVVLHKGPAEPFEVKFKAGYGAPDFWCAAGRFAQNQRISGGTQIYRLTPSPRPQGSGMSFSFRPPPGGGQPTGLVTLGGTQTSLSASAAQEQCTAIALRNRRD